MSKKIKTVIKSVNQDYFNQNPDVILAREADDEPYNLVFPVVFHIGIYRGEYKGTPLIDFVAIVNTPEEAVEERDRIIAAHDRVHERVDVRFFISRLESCDMKEGLN